MACKIQPTEKPTISTILLSFNRLNLLNKTIESYTSTISVPYELIIVDNNSTDGSKEFIESICKEKPNHRAIFLDHDTGGGESINLGIEQSRGEYIHVSENDIEYLPGWDKEVLDKFGAFPELGQISPKSISPGAKQIPKPITNNGKTILGADWITSTCVFRREIWQKGARWYSIKNKQGSKFRPPADVLFSRDVGKLGYLVAWNDKDMVMNLGFRFKEVLKNLDYYAENYRSKWDSGIDRLRKQLLQKGYELVEENGKYRAIKKT